MTVKRKRSGAVLNDNGIVKDSEAQYLSIGKLAKDFGISRSALLYYDKIGLLRPSGRNRANYREYTREDGRRLRLICMYRQIGLSMVSIGRILASPQSDVRDILEKRLLDLGKEISSLRERQHVIIRMLGDRALREHLPIMDKESWISIMKAAGLDDKAMKKWHTGFEKLSPLLHQEFLEGLGIPGEEIALIRTSSRSR